MTIFLLYHAISYLLYYLIAIASIQTSIIREERARSTKEERENGEQGFPANGQTSEKCKELLPSVLGRAKDAGCAAFALHVEN